MISASSPSTKARPVMRKLHTSQRRHLGKVRTTRATGGDYRVSGLSTSGWLSIRVFAQRFLTGLVEALAGQLGLSRDPGVKLWAHAQRNVAGKRLFRRFAELGARLDIIVHRFMKGGNQLGHRVGMKTDHIVDPGDPSDKQTVIGIEGDAGAIALIRHDLAHSSSPVTPSRVKYSRASST